MLLASEIILWLENLEYLSAITLDAPLAVLLSKASPLPPVMIRVIEAHGTTVFIVVGILAAIHSGHELPGCVVAGTITGKGGGLANTIRHRLTRK